MDTKEKLEQFSQYLMARGWSLNYRNSMRLILNYLDENKILFESISQDIITKLFNSRNYSLSSKNQFIKAGRRYGDFLGIPKENNAFYVIKLLPVGYNIPNFITAEEIRDGIKYLKTYHSDICSTAKIDAVFDFLFATGCRKTELLTLKRDRFNLSNNSCKVLGKGNKERNIYFNDRVKQEIELYFSTEEEEFNAFNITSSRLIYLVKLVSKYLNKNIYIHLLRHSAARNMIMKDIPVQIVKEILGHKSLQMTERYTQPNDKMISEKYKEKMNKRGGI